jgi:TP901 family phage tail tape measure protein
MATIGDIKVLVGANIDPLIKGLKKAERQLQSASRNFQNIGDNLMKLSAPLIAVGGLSFKMAADFDDSMRKVAATSGATGEEFDTLRKKALEMGRTTSFTATQSAEALNYMALAGWSAQEGVDGLPGMLSLAAASGTDLAATADILTDTMSAFQMSAKESTDAADVFAQVQSKTNTTVLMLGEAMKYAAPQAASAGQSLRTTAAVMGLLANQGIKGSMAGTAFNSMLADLKKSAENGSVAFGNMNVKLYNADGSMRSMIDIIKDMQIGIEGMSAQSRDAVVSGIFGERGLKAANILLNTSSESINQLTSDLENATGRAAEMQEMMEGGPGGGLRKMRSAIEGAAITLGDAFAPAVMNVVEKITELANWFANLSQETKANIMQVAMWVAGVGVAFKAIGMLIGGIGGAITTIKSLVVIFKMASGAVAAFNAILLANPIGLIAGLIVGLIAVVVQAIRKYESWGAALLLFLGPLGAVINLIQSFRRHWDSVVSAFKTDGILAGLKRIGLVFLDSLLMPMQQLLELASKLPGVGNLAGKAAASIENLRNRLSLIPDAQEGFNQLSRSIELCIDPATALNKELDKTKDDTKPPVPPSTKTAFELLNEKLKTTIERMQNLATAGKANTAEFQNLAAKAIDYKIKIEGIEKAVEGNTKVTKLWNQELTALKKNLGSDVLKNMDFTKGLAKPQQTIQSEKGPGPANPLESLTGGMDSALNSMMGNMQRFGQIAQETKGVVVESFEEMMARMQHMADNGSLVAQMAEGIGLSMMQAADQGAASFADLANAALSAASKIIRSYIMQGVSAAVSKALASIPFPLNMIAGATAGAAAGVLFNSLINKIRAPKLAKGGLAYGPTMAMVGDNPGANVDPEVISPLSKLKDMIGGNVTVNLAGQFKLNGRDLWLAVEKESVVQNRLKGN